VSPAPADRKLLDEIAGAIFTIERGIDWLAGVDSSMTKAEVIDHLNSIADALAYRLHEGAP
jgi:hypothetical protein